ncbi:MAG: EAL domain-containing protein, partial [Vallitaleaceae bacterium]|nr:EAL domain-containing protein [Vallitaleaceae bacterium]
MDIKRIIEQKSIKILFQPILSPLEPLQLNIECFLRGVDTDTGETIMPLCLIEEAKAKDLVLELDKVVVELAFERFKPICDAYPRAFLNININTSIFTKDKKSTFIIDAAKQIGIPTSHVIIDLGFTDIEPESSELVLDFIRVHRDAGFCISLDDIGRDYSNLDKVLLFNPDIIKINHCLIEKLGNSSYR